MPSQKAFASTGDLTEKKVSFTEVGAGLFAFTAEGDPNTGVIVGDDCCAVFDAQATPALAGRVIDKVRAVTDKPIKYVILSHYHAVRVLGASAYQAQGILASQETHRLVAERGQQDWDSEFGRFPRLFRDAQSIPGLTWPWVPDAGVMFTGDLIEYHSACYCGDAHLRAWPHTLNAIRDFNPKAIAPGRGDALSNRQMVNEALAMTRDFVSTLYGVAEMTVAKGRTLKDSWAATREAMDPKFGSFAIYEHCLPFNVSRAFDEASGINDPVIWTAERDRQMWEALQA
jgi:glyoxylase-like metal-dependent hydrolase (beta-lactamase superfamily II)